jgi:drug/metabolite transporter (DMT)-like permease
MSKIKAEAWVLLIVLSLIWGSSFILMKKGLEAYPPMQMASLRICIAALCMLPVTIRHLRKVKGRDLFYIFLFGLTNSGVPAFLFAESETVVSSSTAGILNSLTPIFTFVVGLLFFGVAFNWYGLAGVIIGFAGAFLLVFFGESHAGTAAETTNTALYAGLIVIATVLYGFAGNIIKKHLNTVPGHIVSGFAYLFFAIPLIIWLLFFSDFPSRLVHNPQGIHSLLYIMILAILGSAMAIVLVVRLIQASSALFGSFVTYLIPIVSIMWGLLAGETINFVTLFSLLLIMSGIIIAGLKKQKTITN